jgi:predicted nucleic acid-binding protein
MDYLLDTGILLRIADRNDPRYVVVRAAVESLQAQAHRLFMSPQNVAEFWCVSTRPAEAPGGFGVSLITTEERITALEVSVNLLAESPLAYDHWRRLINTFQVSGKAVHDARLVALMNVQGLTHILTLNPDDFRRYPMLTVLTPENVLAGNP